ncbi:MAG: transketolase [Spirochaetaceae bacterium]|nr:transketolase [Spirochaetaceae bacterium]
MDLTNNEKYLRSMAIQIRANIIEMIPPGKVGHLGGSSSIADVLAVLYFERMKNLDPKNIKNPNRDRLIFSKGHAVLAQYAALVELGYFDREELKKVKTLNGTLQGHPDIDKTPGLEAVTGSLGQGLSISGGMAMALKLDKNEAKVFCVCGDGELAEGQLWEAAMSSVNYKLDNLCLFIDKNSVQATGTTKEIFPIDNISGKFAAFGWHVIDIDGHNIKEIQKAIAEADATKGLPTVIVAKTIKSKGFPFAEGKSQYHNASLTEAQYQECLDCIKKMREEL